MAAAIADAPGDSSGWESMAETEMRGPRQTMSGARAMAAADFAGPAEKRPMPRRHSCASMARKLSNAPAASVTSTYSSKEFVLMRVVCTSNPAAASRCDAAEQKAAALSMSAVQASIGSPRRSVMPAVTVRTFRSGANAADAMDAMDAAAAKRIAARMVLSQQVELAEAMADLQLSAVVHSHE